MLCLELGDESSQDMKTIGMIFAIGALVIGGFLMARKPSGSAMSDHELYAFMQSNIPVGTPRDKVRTFLESCAWTEGKILPDYAHELPVPDFEVYMDKESRVVEIKVRRIHA
jgi:hypothetical protein